MIINIISIYKMHLIIYFFSLNNLKDTHSQFNKINDVLFSLKA